VILDTIVAHKKKEIQERKRLMPTESLKEKCDRVKKRSFSAALRKPGEVSLIAEIKKASPSKGLIRETFDPQEIALIYTSAGSAAISVLTDERFFQGSPAYLKTVRDVTGIPLLRKDFVIDAYQVYEAKLLGADAVLLIMAILSDREAEEFHNTAEELGMESLVEVHTPEELTRALSIGVQIIGINNRDLKTFRTDLSTTFRLREMITDPAVTVVSESGINRREDVIRLRDNAIHAMLVGEALMREKDIRKKALELLGKHDTVPDLRQESAI